VGNPLVTPSDGHLVQGCAYERRGGQEGGY